MKKILTNKKGFTLIELLAVIVVLAIIMVIATQQVNGTIKKSRGNAFYDTVQSIRKSMQTVCATENKISSENLKTATTASDVTFTLTSETSSTNSDVYGTLTVTAASNGKFINVVYPEINTKVYTPGTNMSGGKTVSIPSMSFKTECPTTATTGDQKFEG